MLYMTGITNYRSADEARASGVTFHELLRLECHKDGTAGIIALATSPRQKGQVPYRG